MAAQILVIGALVGLNAYAVVACMRNAKAKVERPASSRATASGSTVRASNSASA